MTFRNLVDWLSPKERFKPNTVLFKAEYPVIGGYSDEQVRDRIYRLMQSEDGQVLAYYLSQKIDRLQDYADDPNTAVQPYLSAHANGGVHAIKGLYWDLLSQARSVVQAADKRAQAETQRTKAPKK
jgi:hypothetical protein